MAKSFDMAMLESKVNIMSDPLLWFLIGLTFLVGEFVLPGFIIAFFGLGAWVVWGTTAIGLTNSLESQLITFIISSLVFIFSLRKFMKKWFVGDSKNGEVSVDEEYIGHKVMVVKAIPGGAELGKIEIKGAEWNARSEKEIAEGVSVEITKRDGLTFVVKTL